MAGNALRDRLREFGFTDKEIETYLSILTAGETTVNEIVEGTEVSRRHVYTIAGRLEERGFIEMADYLKPTVLRPAPPETVSKRLEKNVEDLRTAIESQYVDTFNGTRELSVLKSRETVITRIRQFIEGAEEMITIGAPPTVLEILADDLAAAVNRGVFVLAIVYSSEDDPDVDFDVGRIAHAVRLHPDEVPLEMSVDGRRSLVSHKDVVVNPDTNRHAIVFTEPYLQRFVYGAFLNNKWRGGTEVHVTEPDDLPATFSNHFYTVFQATLHHRNDERLRAIVEARPTESDRSPVVLEGEVVDIYQQLIEPQTSESIESAIELRLDDGRTVTVGGEGAYLEEYEALSTRIEPG